MKENIAHEISYQTEKGESIKKAQNNKIENVAGLVDWACFMDGSDKSP